MGKEERNNAADPTGEKLMLPVRVPLMRISTEPFMP